MQSIGDVVMLLSVLVALWIVPRYFWRVYGNHPSVKAFVEWLRPVMASPENRPSSKADIEAVSIPIWHTTIPALRLPETDNELLEILADYRRPDNKFRFSANQIYTLIGGDRNTVMRQIKELREGKSEAVYREITPTQQAQREALGLPNR